MRTNIIDQCSYKSRFLQGLTPDTRIYKYIPITYVESMFKNKKLIFGKVNDWEDVYENYFLKQDLRTSDNNLIDTSNIMNRCYGQSWSSLEESDAMWRIYSLSQNAVKVATTVEKLMDVLYDEDSCCANTSIGNVIYKSRLDIEKKLDELQQNGVKLGPSLSLEEVILQSLYTKRSEFEHEREVRILRMNDTNVPAEQSLDVKIDPQDLFEEIIIDPRVREDQYKESMNMLISAGADSSKIKQSQLYTMNKFTICLR